MPSLTVPLRVRAYTVHIEPGFSGLGPTLQGEGVRRVVVVTEPVVANLWLSTLISELEGAGILVQHQVLALTEATKTFDLWRECVEGLLELGVDRRTVVVALGGGVVGDVAGFAAASVLRGLRIVQVPTTLLAMVDSSVGGKTGINSTKGKNLIGAFHQPMLVWAPVCALQTLEEAEYLAGFGEVIKIALVADAALFAELEVHAAPLLERSPDALMAVIQRSVVLKAEIVASDEKESGLRMVLNAGHTVAHGIEAASGFQWRHGAAVAVGLVAEARWAERQGHAAGVVERLVPLLRRFQLPIDAPETRAESVLVAMRLDKKNADAMLIVPVPVEVGRAELIRHPISQLAELIEGLSCVAFNPSC